VLVLVQLRPPAVKLQAPQPKLMEPQPVLCLPSVLELQLLAVGEGIQS
jgi:hypothetical protein